MATKPRKHSNSGFYHCFQRGVNQCDIFEDDDDRLFLLERLKKYADEVKAEVHAWCLMDNHYHLVIRAELGALSALMRKTNSVYAKHFNMRHRRSGPLFEGRFSSVCIETDDQLLSTIRYVHRNPIRHDKTTLCGQYPWTSYGEYVLASPTICRIDVAAKLFENREGFLKYHEIDRDYERHLDLDTSGPMRDDEARWRADEILRGTGFEVSVSNVSRLSRADRDKALWLIAHTIRCSLRQLQRLTAVAYSAIHRAVKEGHAIEEAAVKETPHCTFGQTIAEPLPVIPPKAKTDTLSRNGYEHTDHHEARFQKSVI